MREQYPALLLACTQPVIRSDAGTVMILLEDAETLVGIYVLLPMLSLLYRFSKLCQQRDAYVGDLFRELVSLKRAHGLHQ